MPTYSSTVPGGWRSLVFDDGYAIASAAGGTFLERCGTNLHRFLTFTTPGSNCPRLDCPPAMNSHMIVWQSAAGLMGIFLPSMRRFTIAVPKAIDPNSPGFANGDYYQLALTATRLYLAAPDNQIWSMAAPAQTLPAKRHGHRAAWRRRAIRKSSLTVLPASPSARGVSSSK